MQQSRSRTQVVLFALFGTAGVLQVADALFATIDGTDYPSHYAWITEFRQLIESGVAFPHWVAAGYHGLGSALFYFYPPLTYYLTTALSATGITDARVLFGILAALTSIASVATAYQLLRNISAPRAQALLGGLVYAFAPFRVAEGFSRASLSSEVGYVFLPLIALGLIWIFEDRERFSPRGVTLLAVSSAALILSSLPATATVVCFLLPIGIAMWRRFTRRAVIELLLSGVLIAALTAFYWVPAITHVAYISQRGFEKDPNFYLSALLHLRITTEFVHAALIILALAVTCAYIIRRRSFTPLNVALLAACAIYVFLEIPPVAGVLWRDVPLLKIIQVPWRLHIVLVLLLAAFVAKDALQDVLQDRMTQAWLGIWGFAAIGTAALVLFNLHFFTHWVAVDAYPPEYLPRNAPEEVVHRAIFTPDELRHASIDSASAADSVVLTDRAAESETYRVLLRNATTVHLRQLFWPDWVATVDGKQLRSFEDSSGLHSMSLPAGSYELKLHLITTPAETTSRWISAAALAAVIALASIGGRSAAQSRHVDGR